MKSKEEKIENVSIGLQRKQINWIKSHPEFELSRFVRHMIDEQMEMFDDK